MKDKILYNAGIIAGDYEAVSSFALAIYLLCSHAQVEYCDQAGMNILLTFFPFKDLTRFVESHEGWACHGGVIVPNDDHPGPLLESAPVVDRKYIRTTKSEIYTCVHQYDKVPEWKRLIEKEWRRRN